MTLTIRKSLAAGLGTSLLIFSATTAAEYTIQIGAFKDPDSAAVKTAEEFGTMYRAQAGEFTRIQIGRFDRAAEAQDSLEGLRSIGFQDAFVTRVSSGSYASEPATASAAGPVAVTQSDSADQEYTRTAPVTSTQAERASQFEGLSADEQQRAVFLDGQLKIKVNDEFLSLEDYRSRF